jgi:hypothetical protein
LRALEGATGSRSERKRPRRGRLDPIPTWSNIFAAASDDDHYDDDSNHTVAHNAKSGTLDNSGNNK